MSSSIRRILTLGVLSLPVIVAALGYFVDIYDLVLVGMVGKASLLGIGVSETEAVATMGHLLGLQMIGMLVGGFAWGMIADRWGRVATLFGSILTYSTATLLNGFITELWQYEVLRVIAGFGLAGELGVGITLVVESLPKQRRAFGATLVACVGIAGALLAWLINRHCTWQQAYIIGGLMGYALLVLRWLSHESGLFANLDASIAKGSLRLLFASRERVLRYARSVLLGTMTWFVIGVFAFLAPKTAAALGCTEPVTSANAIVWAYIGLIAGDLAAGFITHALASRKRALLGYFVASALACAVVLGAVRGCTPQQYYAIACLMGVTVGFWALFVTVSAEQFGTNLRATVATTVPNVARGLFFPIQWAITAWATSHGFLTVVGVIGVVVFALAFAAWWKLEETHDKDLDYLEEVA